MLPDYDRVDDNFRGDLSDKWSTEYCPSDSGCRFRISLVRGAFCARFVHEGSPRHRLLDSASRTAFVVVMPETDPAAAAKIHFDAERINLGRKVKGEIPNSQIS